MLGDKLGLKLALGLWLGEIDGEMLGEKEGDKLAEGDCDGDILGDKEADPATGPLKIKLSMFGFAVEVNICNPAMVAVLSAESVVLVSDTSSIYIVMSLPLHTTLTA